MTLTRRAFLHLAGGALALPVVAQGKLAPAPGVDLAAAWDTPRGAQVGVLRIADSAGATPAILAAIDVPTRAHAIVPAGDDSVLMVARRPGDWLLRLRRGRGGALRVQGWQWIEPQRAFNGHVLVDAPGRRIFTTETDLETGAGLLGVRDSVTLRKVAEWPTHGLDPHEILWMDDGERVRLAVANGGIATFAETGRTKHDLPRMDPSLAFLRADTGALDEQVRLSDSRLSIRHLARHGGTLGVALQAEHDNAQARGAAPVLALWSRGAFATIDAPRPLAGYGGAVVATVDGFAVSCPRAGGVARYDTAGHWRSFTPLPDACALAWDDGGLWIGGGAQVMHAGAGRATTASVHAASIALDNHWALLP